MSGLARDRDFYVAPPEPPPSRRPPITEVGPLGWMRANLFSSKGNAVATIITATFIVWFLWMFVSWSVRSAQWGVIYNNLRLVTSGLYDRREIWRMEVVAGLLVFLSGLSFGIWGRLPRSTFLVVGAVLVILVIVPVIGAWVPRPTIYVLVEPKRDPANFVFVGLKGEEVSFTFDPLTDLADAEERLVGFVENQSRTEWSTQAFRARAGETDLSQYNLAVSVRLLDGNGKAVLPAPGSASGQFVADPVGGTLKYILPADDWYVLEAAIRAMPGCASRASRFFPARKQQHNNGSSGMVNRRVSNGRFSRKRPPIVLKARALSANSSACRYGHSSAILRCRAW